MAEEKMMSQTLVPASHSDKFLVDHLGAQISAEIIPNDLRSCKGDVLSLLHLDYAILVTNRIVVVKTWK